MSAPVPVARTARTISQSMMALSAARPH